MIEIENERSPEDAQRERCDGGRLQRRRGSLKSVRQNLRYGLPQTQKNIALRIENPALRFTEPFQVFSLDHAPQRRGIAAPTTYGLVMRHDIVELETFLPGKRLYRFVQRTRKCVTLRLRESVQLLLNFEYRLFEIDT